MGNLKKFHVITTDVDGTVLFNGDVTTYTHDGAKAGVIEKLNAKGIDTTFATTTTKLVTTIGDLMVRYEAEHLIYKKMLEIAEIYKAYNPNGDYLSLCMHLKNGKFSANNTYYSEDKEYPIDFWTDGEMTNRNDLDDSWSEGTP